MLNRLRDLLIDGILLALPLAATAYLLHKLFGSLLQVLSPVTHLLPPGHYFGMAALDLAALGLLVVALIALGAFARSALGTRIAQSLERIVLSKIPGYLVIKSIAADMSSTEGDTSMKPALVSFDDNTVLGFVVEQADAGDMVTVFIPDAPGAASGSVVLVLRERVQPLDVATSAAMRTMKQRGVGLQALPQAKAMHSSRASAPAPLLATPRRADVRPASR
jgi:uncharacterized membrane protein